MGDRSFRRRWQTANALGLSIGMTVSLTAFLARPSGPAAYGVWAVSGICVAAAQMVASPIARSHPARWLTAGAIAPTLGIPFGMATGLVAVMALPSWLLGPTAAIPRAVMESLVGVLPGAIAGACTGFTLGAFQTPALPRHAPLRTRWILTSATAWLAAGALFGGILIVSGSSFPLAPSTLIQWSRWLLSIMLLGGLGGWLAGAIVEAPELSVEATTQQDAA